MARTFPLPRIERRDLKNCLEVLAGEYGPDTGLMSHNPEWIRSVSRAAKAALLHLPHGEEAFGKVTAHDLPSLAALQEKLSHFLFFGMAVSHHGENHSLTELIRHAALESGKHALFLMPDYRRREDVLRLYDPFPAMALIAEQPECWPGILFWSRSGRGAFSPIEEAPKLFHNLIYACRNGLDALNSVMSSFQVQRSSRRILHLSDLHFGTREADNNHAHLTSHLGPVVKGVNRTVITGDLFNSPTRLAARKFNGFRDTLALLSGHRPIVVPGNHDQKILGNSIFRFLGRRWREQAQLEWSRLVVDDQIECVFLCFDSSRDADLARGCISNEQLNDVAERFEQEVALRPEIATYLRIALLHHHPLPFGNVQETFIQKSLALLRLSEEAFIGMDGGEDFIKWCAQMNIGFILHGHKHIPRFVIKRVNRHQYENAIDVRAVGCGTSLGAEGMPLSYNRLSWDPRNKVSGVAFYSCPQDCSGFVPEFVEVQRIP